MSLSDFITTKLALAGLPTSLAIAVFISSLLLIGALALALHRIIVGPTPFDRVVALDLVGGVCLCVLTVCAIKFNQPVLLEAAFAIALVSFLSTVVFARHLGEKES